jgi:hypothetical protein
MMFQRRASPHLEVAQLLDLRIAQIAQMLRRHAVRHPHPRPGFLIRGAGWGEFDPIDGTKALALLFRRFVFGFEFHDFHVWLPLQGWG